MVIPKWIVDQLPSQGSKALLVGTLPATVLAIAAYYIWKRRQNSQSLDNAGGYGRKRRDRYTECVEIRIPKDMVGTIIGKEGATIKELQAQTNTRIKVDEGGGDVVDMGPDECLVRILGSDCVSVQLARQRVATLVSSKADVFTVTVPLPQQMVGRVIGKGGLRIRDLQRASGARIIIEKSKPTESGGDGGGDTTDTSTTTTIIKGTVDQIDLAKTLIQEILDEAAEFEVRLQKAIANRHRRGHGESAAAPVKSEESVPVQSEDSMPVKSEEIVPVKFEESAPAKSEESVPVKAENGVAGGLVNGSDSEPPESATGQPYSLPMESLVSEHADGYVAVMVSQVVSPRHFYAQKANDRVDKLNEGLDALYSSSEGYHLGREEMREGALVAARFTDGKWYRGRITGVDTADDDTVHVFFLDFGDYLRVGARECRQLLGQFQGLPQQAVECYLHGAAEVGERREEAMDMLDELTQGDHRWKLLMLRHVHARATDGRPCVRLVDTSNERDVDIAQRLLQENLLAPDHHCQ